ncbi:ribonuclease Phyb [Galendromus occidentalis]|uniref:Ribonuclease Phyb n=1 Tax=Galendromus occidentalis TaxID=34638 RepID=A0AAJ6QWL1_9ACAR|nr:ribonuclease Phyb [Galendromus occidentalis]
MRSFMKTASYVLALLSSAIGVYGFDFLVFAQQHPPGYCRSTFKQKCIADRINESFTVHGLWPSAKDDSIQNCDSRKFDVKDVQPIRSRLEKAWPSFRTNDPTVFWAHEWKKHGTCGLGSPNLAGIFNYFNTTLTLHDRFDLRESLRKNGITASSKTPYEINKIRKALARDVQGNVQLICDKAEGYSNPILTEVRLCLTENLEVLDCPFKKERCGKDLIFFLPQKQTASGGNKVGGLTVSNLMLPAALVVCTIIFHVNF